MVDRRDRRPWARVITLGEARFGILVGGPFDGRCYPLQAGTPRELQVPAPHGASAAPIRYVLREGCYRFAGDAAAERSAA
jgi:hypothetical protein